VGEFFVAIEIDLKHKGQQEILTCYFFLCNKLGFHLQEHSEELDFVKIVDHFSIEFVKKFIQENIIRQCEELNDLELIKYLESNFNFEESNS